MHVLSPTFELCQPCKLFCHDPLASSNRIVTEWTTRSCCSSGSRGGGGRAPPCRPKKKKKEKTSVSGQVLLFPNVLQVLKLLLVTPWQPRPWSVLTRPRDSSSQTTAARCLRGAWMHCCACMSTRTHNWILKKWWWHTGINIQEECCWVDRWMHHFLHVEHLLLDLPDLPSDFKYCVNIVNICTNYLENSLSDFSEIIPKIVKYAYLRIAIFKISRGSMPPDPP